MNYGFHTELVAKYGGAAKGIYTRVLKARLGLPWHSRAA
jgi:hypothetical protein